MTDFSLQISDWYRRNKRDLPWRNTNNPYFIWLSEIILQQTRVDQGLNYYLKFIKNYPSISELANADEQKILNDWQGLGYYSRARNLHFTAKTIVREYNGKFPDKHEEILKLKGIGDYTAAAIASFSFGLNHAVVDGNVYRVLSRVFDISTPIDSPQGKKEFTQLAQELLPSIASDIHNQAIMEFGALQCTPKNPDCLNCIIQTKCLSYAKKNQHQLPVKLGKTKIRNRYFYYFILKNKTEIIISKRIFTDIWKHLFEFPIMESEIQLNESEITKMTQEKYGCTNLKIIQMKKHILSHQHIYSSFIIIENDKNLNEMLSENHEIIKLENLQDYPFPKLISNFLDNHMR